MPCCQIVANVQVEKGIADAFLAGVESTMRHNGSDEPSANVCLHAIGGINSRNNNKFCAEVSALCQKHLGVPADRVFFQFVDTSPANFGVGSQVFG